VFVTARSTPLIRGGKVKMTQPGRLEALERLDIFVGEWALEASFPGGAPAAVREPGPARRDDGEPGSGVYSRFAWALDGRFLMQRTEVRLPGAPDSLAIVAFDPGQGAYTQPGRMGEKC
jgi:hypothetical protein